MGGWVGGWRGGCAWACATPSPFPTHFPALTSHPPLPPTKPINERSSEEGKSIVKGLLERRVANRLGCGPTGAAEIKVWVGVCEGGKETPRKGQRAVLRVSLTHPPTTNNNNKQPPFNHKNTYKTTNHSGTRTSRATTGRRCWPRATRPSSCPRAAAAPSTSTTSTSA